MIPYYGKHGEKQHIHRKPIDFAYKLWSLCTSTGYVVRFIPYQGPKSIIIPDQKTLGLGASVVLKMISILPKNYHFYLDRFFTRFPLLKKLTELGHFSTGTIKKNRTEKCLLNFKVLRNEKRVTMDMATTDNLAVVDWKDNKVVTLASNAYAMHLVKR